MSKEQDTLEKLLGEPQKKLTPEEKIALEAITNTDKALPLAKLPTNNNLKEWRHMCHRAVSIFSPILFAATYVEDNVQLAPGMPMTACLRPDMLEIRYNPNWMITRSPEANAFTMAHEAAHYLCEHLPRRLAMKTKEGTDFELGVWMIAEDLAVNNLVCTLTGWKWPVDGVPEMPEYKGLTTEEIYRELKKLPRQKPKACYCCIDPKSGDVKLVDAAGEMLKLQVSETVAKEIKKMCEEKGLQPGNMPGELKEIAARVAPLKRPPNWKEMLKRYLVDTEFNAKYFDPSTLYRRRLSIDGLCVPNLASQPCTKKFIVSIDNSGSVSDAMFNCLIGVINSAAQQLGFQEIIVQHFTTQVMKTERCTTMKQVMNIGRKASGGTELDDCDAKAAEHRGQFHLILTDGYVSWLQEYSLPTIIVRTVASTEEPYRGRNLIGSVIADAEKDFEE